MFLTQESGLIMGPISKLLGLLLNGIYELSSNLGIVSIGLSIILFTLVVRLCMVPSMFKQRRSSKIQQYIQPELNKINKKYRNKKDQESMLKQQAEVRELQDKYGVNLTGGCLSAILQMPIFFGLYNVIQNIPAYVNKVKDLYIPIADAIQKDSNAFDKLSQYKDGVGTLKVISMNNSNTNTIIDVLAKFDNSSWEAYKELLGGNSIDVVNAINENMNQINDVYSFIGGINLATAPGFALTAAFIIPIMSLVFQYLSMHATPMQGSGDPQTEATMKSMKTMMNVMPIMSFFVTVNVPAGVGLYWATGSLLSFITSKTLYFYYEHADIEKIVEKSKEKAAKKIEKRKASGKKTFAEKMAEAAYGQQPQENTAPKSNIANSRLKNYTSSTMKTQNSGTVKYREGSLAAKANALQKFNDNNGGKN
ncbi:MAG: YidC/Oxa1 family membrane protein insertase [Lachnospiraceae bacterium]|nr:YidC/Oxa1 family membrane protein insertase [Lachnospiraceae bacterium]